MADHSTIITSITLLGINQENDLERLISDVMNQKVSPNALAESQELVKLGNALECLKNTLKLTVRKYPAIHTNYIISHCTTLQYNNNI